MEPCPHCNGQGWFEGQETSCCGNGNPDGSCCGNGIAVQTQEQCPACGGTGLHNKLND